MNERASQEADSVVIECDLAEPPEKVWRALTAPELVAAWLLPNTLHTEIGGEFVFSGKDAGLSDRIECKVLDAEPNRILRYSWQERPDGRSLADNFPETEVTFLLAETITGGTHLRIIHSGLARGRRFPPASFMVAANSNLPPAARRAA